MHVWHCIFARLPAPAARTDGEVVTGVPSAGLLVGSLGAALVLASVHVFSQKLRILGGVPRNRLLSAVGGMAVAFVVLKLLPAIAAHQQTLEQATRGTALGALGNHVYILLLLSLLMYYGLELLARRSQEQSRQAGGNGDTSAGVFWIHMASFALMNLLIGYMLVDHAQAGKGWDFLIPFSLAMLFKFIVADHGLHSAHGGRYDRIGRWLLAAAVLGGLVVNYIAVLPAAAPALLQAFIAGGVLLNVLKEELPKERNSRYWVFFAGAAAYSVLLLTR